MYCLRELQHAPGAYPDIPNPGVCRKMLRYLDHLDYGDDKYGRYSHLSVPEEFPTQMTFGFVWGIDIMLEIGVSSEFSQDSRIKQVYKPQVVPVDASEIGILDIIKPVNNGITSFPKLVFMFFFVPWISLHHSTVHQCISLESSTKLGKPHK